MYIDIEEIKLILVDKVIFYTVLNKLVRRQLYINLTKVRSDNFSYKEFYRRTYVHGCQRDLIYNSFH